LSLQARCGGHARHATTENRHVVHVYSSFSLAILPVAEFSNRTKLCEITGEDKEKIPIDVAAISLLSLAYRYMIMPASVHSYAKDVQS
jgi:hypothetical protein